MSETTSRTPSDVESPAVVDDLTPAEGRYLCGVLYRTLVGSTPVSNHELTEYLGVSGASVTGMIESLAAERLLEYERYRGVELTDRGEWVARAVLWRRCAIQKFFEQGLGLSLKDNRAYRIGFELSREQVRTIGDRTDQPCRDHCEASSAAECDVFPD
ncbi:metal-dependent transcriptional regulator [Halorhabdus rudnickae]|uniref:metal-dependent transcriptional regulator n=1 Tax=Halorhabdus rudnickae TaxID=1775544 RepID=UPI0010830890|nr:metal-dependent transcriptional regulator [Halorhabdus rudnickae]